MDIIDWELKTLNQVYKYTTHVFSRVFREFFVKYMFLGFL